MRSIGIRWFIFFHEADGEAPSEKVIKAIAAEQSSGWFYLKKLLEKWSKNFSGYEDRIRALNDLMKGHEVFLDTVFDNIKP